MGRQYLGMIKLMVEPGRMAPYDMSDWVECKGQYYSISQHTALFSLLGARFGGNGLVNFALPNLQGKSPVAGHAYYICIKGEFPRRD